MHSNLIITWLCYVEILIAHQDDYACRARYCCGKSVRQSVRHTLVLYRNECKYRQSLSAIWQGRGFSFLSVNAVTKFQWGVKYTWLGKFAIFDRNRRFLGNGTRQAHSYYGTLIGSHRRPIDQSRFQ